MLQAKFHGTRVFGSREEDFEVCLYMGVAAIPSWANIRFHYLWRLDTKFGFFSQAVYEMFEHCERQTDLRA